MIVFTDPCPQCGGTGGEMHQHIVGVAGHAPGCEGSTCERTCPVEVPMPVDEWEPCNHCHQGKVPDDGTVEAVRDVLRREFPCHCDEAYTGRGLVQPSCVIHDLEELSGDLLVAAARYQSERGG